MKKLITLFLALALGFGLKAQCPYTVATDCNAPAYDPQVTVTINEVTETTANVSFFPNDDCAAYYYNIYTESEMQAWIDATGLSAGEVLQNYGFDAIEETTHEFDGLQPGEVYFVWVVPADVNGVLYDVQQVLVEYVPGPGEEMVDFTATDIDGNEIHLYDILDAGQTVLINLFLRDDNSAQIIPFVTESYRLFGCNQNDVFYMEICPQDEDEECRVWAERFGVDYPTISRTGGGNDIAQSIPVIFYPTVIIVNPDHTYAYRDLYPIEGTFTIVDALTGLGCEQHACLEETLTFSMDMVNIVDNQYDLNWITVYNNTAEDAIVTGIYDERELLAFNIDGEDIYCYEPIEVSIPQGESRELGIICNVIAKGIVSDVVTLTSNLPDASFVVVLEEPWSVNENEVSAKLFPNPANDFVTLNGESLGTVRVFNALGQKVDEFEANGSELRISTTGYGNGMYFVKTDKATLRFVVNH